MDAFPDDYTVHNLPLILLSGLDTENQNDAITGEGTRTYLGEGGFRIRAELPTVQGNTAKALHKALLAYDSSEALWHSQPFGKGGPKHAYKIRSVGRTYTLPPRKAPPPPHSPRLRPAADNNQSPTPLVLHSTLSPLTPSSPLYPDGIITPLWITKHQSRLPSAFVSFYTLTSDANSSSLQDNKVKSEVNQVRTTINSTNYKTRYAVVLIGDGPIRQAELEERLTNIRRAANLEPKTLFYLPHDASPPEITEFVDSVLSSLHPICVEYYRDLSKHARRKRNRNTVPQPTIQPTSGTSAALSLPGWNVRYEFKLGVFAEFRQEMEAACRNYETAYEALFGSEVLEAISSWSPRFNEARLLADIIAFRVIRCLLWSSQTSAAVQLWILHRSRIRDLIDRRGKGTENYGWEAWQSTWSKTMADLIGRAGILQFQQDETSNRNAKTVFAIPERSIPTGERIMPWDHLHHPGYWLSLAQRHAQNRRTRALQMPQEDRVPPDRSPASTIASKTQNYDVYLAPEPYEEFPIDGRPGYDHHEDVLKTLEAAIEHFSAHKQIRMTQVLEFRRAAECVRTASWTEASYILKNLWMDSSWRDAGWWILIQDVGQILLRCATELRDRDLAAQIQWEMRSPVVADQSLLEDLKDTTSIADDTPVVALNMTTDLSPLVPSFVFASAEGHVGEHIKAQLSLTLFDRDASELINVSEIKVVFEGGIKPIILRSTNVNNSESPLAENQMVDIQLQESSDATGQEKRSSMSHLASWTAETDISISTGRSKIFNIAVVPREAGPVSVASITVLISDHNQSLTLTASQLNETPSFWWESRKGKPKARQIGKNRDGTTVTVLPKPPKMDILIPNLSKVYYTNEEIILNLEVLNNEERKVEAALEGRLISPRKSEIAISWTHQDEIAKTAENEAGEAIQILPKLSLGEIDAGSSMPYSLRLINLLDAVDHELELVISYSLVSDPETPLTKIIAIDIPVTRPFEANTLFHPRVHEEHWPSFFTPPATVSGEPEESGLKQQYLVATTLASFAADTLEVRSLKLVSKKIVGGATASSSIGRVRSSDTTNNEAKSVTLSPEEAKHFEFELTMQKHAIGDRQPVAADFVIEVDWCRPGSESSYVSVLALPRFLAPMSEPRVLLKASRIQGDANLYQLLYTIENPSMHFLTFNITMESGEDFAFSGTKSKTVSLVPISRYDLVYQILMYKSKEWVKVHLEVLDAYFGQTLKIQPAGDGIKVDKQGNVLLWVE